MSVGILLLIITGLLIYFGAAQRVLDKLYLTDSAALLIIALLIIGSFFEVTILRDPLLTINAGGAVVPIILSIYILSRADSAGERLRTIAAVFLTAMFIYAVSILFSNFGHGRDILDPMYIYAISGGIIAYLLGRSRRASFIAGTMGFLVFNLFTFFKALAGTINAQTRLGGGGIFDSMVISGIFAVLLAELLGESLERLRGGHRDDSK
ncbi:MAG: DUF1614 domain-containing protein [Halanaerobiaceae bacterium]|nr:DUF1614 domain-containing protein [Halanaerobiaceae bacterium]